MRCKTYVLANRVRAGVVGVLQRIKGNQVLDADKHGGTRIIETGFSVQRVCHARVLLSGIYADDRRIRTIARWIPATLRRHAGMTVQ